MHSNKNLFSKSYLAYACIRGLNEAIESDIKNVIKVFDSNFPKFRLLWILYFEKSMNMSELTFIAQTNMSNVFRQLTKLKEEGLVTIQNEEDARIKNITLTEDGKNIIANFINQNCQASELQIVRATEKITNKDFETFLKVAKMLTADIVGEDFANWAVKSADIIAE